jgi:truncated hemoglobin YjbI
MLHRHAYFTLTSRKAEKWLDHMAITLEETPEIDEEQTKMMMDYFKYSAYFLVAGQEATNVMEQMHDYDHIKPSIRRDHDKHIASK